MWTCRPAPAYVWHGAWRGDVHEDPIRLPSHVDLEERAAFLFGSREIANALIGLRVSDEGLADSLGGLLARHRRSDGVVPLGEASLLACCIE